MKPGFKLPAASVAVLLIQLLLVGSIAAKYMYQRWTCPRVWTRTAASDQSLLIRGRYVNLQLMVDGCQSTLPSAKGAEFPRDYNGAAVSGEFVVRGEGVFPAELRVVNGRLTAIYIRDGEKKRYAQNVAAVRGAPCDQMRLVRPVDFYISERATNLLPLSAGTELWIEVTVPPKGPPRPIQLARKRNGGWEPLGLQ